MTEQNPLTITEAAKFLDVSKSHLYKLTSQGAIPHYKPRGGRVYFLPEDLIEWIRSGRVKTADEIDQQSTDYVAA